jgi:hypothetical protein
MDDERHCAQLSPAPERACSINRDPRNLLHSDIAAMLFSLSGTMAHPDRSFDQIS